LTEWERGNDIAITFDVERKTWSTVAIWDLIRFAKSEVLGQWSKVNSAYTGQNHGDNSAAYTGQNDDDNSAAYTGHNPDGNNAAYTRAHTRPNNSRHNMSENARAPGLNNGKQ
jgi:hypothetical protein